MPQASCHERDLFEQCAAGDRAARDALVERFMPLARSVARRYFQSGEPFDDLIQVACLGLVQAVDRFDPARGVSFSSYAVPTILGEIKRHFRDRTWAVHVPRALNELSLKVDEIVRRRTQAEGHAPTVATLCEATGASEEQVLEALEVGRARRLPSLDAKARRGVDDDATATVGELIASPRADRDCEERDARLLIQPLLKSLAPRDELIVRLRYERDMTQAEIGELIGVSQMQVSRLLRRALSTMHDRGAVEPDEPATVRPLVAA
jgi:RNA polymerase sigma-B factor